MRVGKVAGVSDTGRKRRRNEDSYVCRPPLFAVADGVGGARAGELASSLAAEALSESAGSARLPGEERVASLIREANRRVYERASSDQDLSGMGTTMTLALADDGVVAIGHVGDSRAYLIRDGRLEQVTQDHSLVAELMRDGRLSPEEAATHPQRSVITRVLGTDPDVDVDTFSVRARRGDLFLLCSDGLTGMLSDEQILMVVERHRDNLDAAARALIKAANRGGGDDNITVVFFEIADAEEPSGEATATLPKPALAPEADEDTLSELGAIPPLEVLPAKPESRRRRGARVLLGTVALLAVTAACVLGLFALSRAHFVGAEDDGRVAVYQGVPYDLFSGVRLYRAVYVSPLLSAQLSGEERRRLFDHDLRSRNGALDRLEVYEQEIVR